MRGLDLMRNAPVEIAVPPDASVRSRRGLIVRCGLISPGDVVEIDGIPLTSVARTWFDLARHQPLIEAVAAVDWALHRRLVRWSVLRAYVDCHSGSNGVRQARRVLDYAQARAETLMESRLRMLLILGGLPRPQVQAEIGESGSPPTARLDLYYPAARLGIEFDGGHHRATLVEDNRRQNTLLVRFGIHLLRFTGSDYYTRPDATVEEVRLALSNATKGTLAPKSAWPRG
jgi:very-short-patch-repair endonuclease